MNMSVYITMWGKLIYINPKYDYLHQPASRKSSKLRGVQEKLDMAYNLLAEVAETMDIEVNDLFDNRMA